MGATESRTGHDGPVPSPRSDVPLHERGAGSPRSAPSGGTLLRLLTLLRFGVLGQGLAFAAMVLPILLRQTEQVFVLVFASAVAVMLCYPALLAFPFVFPVVRGPRMARVATVWSLVALAVVSAAIVPLTPLEPALDLPRGTFVASAALTATLGVYLLLVSRFIRAEDNHGIGLSRLLYGVVVLSATAVACATSWGPLTLTYANSLAYALTAAGMALRREHWGPALPRAGAAIRRRLRRAYLRRTVRPALASLAGGWTSFLPGLLLPGLGSAAEPWAVISRICGGFSTVLIQLVSPPLEGRLSRSVRDRDPVAFAAARRVALLAGMGAGVGAVALGIALAAWATGPGTDEWLLPLTVAAVLFWVPLLAGSPINRLPNFLGRDSARLYWDVARGALLTAIFFTAEGTAELILMGIVLSAAFVALLPLSAWRPRSSSADRR